MHKDITVNIAINNDAIIPTKGSALSAGYDLYSTVDECIKPNERKLIDTGMQLEIPFGVYGRIAPRSGLAVKFGVDVMAGVIDPDYRGNIKVLLINHGDTDFIIHKGDRIAQLIFEVCATAIFTVTNILNTTIRGANGFGSTGMQKI